MLQLKASDGDINSCLNPSKTKVIIVMPLALKESIIIKGTFSGNDFIRFVTSAKNLDVFLDDVLSFEPQIISFLIMFLHYLEIPKD